MPAHRLDRRGFLAGVVAAGAALSLGADPAHARRKRLWTVDDGSRAVPPAAAGDPRRVIVIGAGFAGLTAANALATAGVDVVVLEARRRTGGRIHTVSLGGRPFDLGGAWIHDPVGNPLTELARRAGMDTRRLAINDAIARAGFHDSDAGWLDEATRVRLLTLLAGFEAEAPLIVQQRGDSISVADLVEAYLATKATTGDDIAFARTMLRTVLETYASGPLERQSVHSLGGAEGEGLSDDVPVGGYGGLVDALSHPIRDKIRLGTTVTQIATRGRTIRVRDARGRSFTGSHVIVTVPLGVLKGRGSIAFDPGWPAATSAAVDALGFGVFEKVALTFDRPFWTDRGPAFLMRGDGPVPGWYDWSAALGRPALVGLCAAGAGQGVARAAADRAVGGALRQLRQAFDSVPRPTAARVSRWTRDPFTRGGYTYLAVGSTPETIATLAEPIRGRVLLAGEAASVERHGYADGAFTTGVREAKRLLREGAVKLTV